MPVRPVFSTLFAVLLASACSNSDRVSSAPAPKTADAVAPAENSTQRLQYPLSARGDHVDVYHKTEVPDPYRWLEDLDGEQTRAWIGAQNELTFAYLEKIGAREALRARLAALWDFEQYHVPQRHGDRYVMGRKDGLQNQPVLYKLATLTAEPEVLLDPNTLSSDGTVALGGIEFSHDGTKMAYGLAQAGSDWEVWRVRDVASGQDTTDELRWIKFAEPSWTKDGKGLFYARYDRPKAGAELAELNYNQKIFFHKLGDPQEKDRLVYARPDHKEWGFDTQVTDDGRYLIIKVRIGTDPKYSIFYQDLRRPKSQTVELLPDFMAHFEFLGNDGPTFWFMTDHEAPKGRVVAIDIRKPDAKKWRELIAQRDDALEAASIVGDRIFARYLDNASSKVRVHRLDGSVEHELALPGLGSVGGFTGKRGHSETFYEFSSFTTPSTIYRYEIGSHKAEVFRRPQLQFDPNDYETTQVFVTSKDGTRVPMFLSHKKGLGPNGALPTYLYGYGGFNISITPRFSVPNLVWMEMGGLLAVPTLRGGGEFGEQWHQAGIKTRKQNVFDDFIAAATWLIDNGYTNPQRLAIGGRSNGGLLVGAAITQRPDLFAAALPGVGVLDMLRFNKFTIGWAWESDYGSPENPEEFAALLAYSPLHNVEARRYPATLAYTADHDDRVVPAHSYKFIAALQHAHTGDAPILIRIDTKAGHGAGKPTTKQVEEWADLWGFLVYTLQMNGPGPSKAG